MNKYLKLFINRLNAEEEILNLKKEIRYKDIIIDEQNKIINKLSVCKIDKELNKYDKI